jgi:hypothetical protein
VKQLIVIGYDETLRYIHDFLVKNPPFDVGVRYSGNGVRGEEQYAEGAGYHGVLTRRMYGCDPSGVGECGVCRSLFEFNPAVDGGPLRADADADAA